MAFDILSISKNKEYKMQAKLDCLFMKLSLAQAAAA